MSRWFRHYAGLCRDEKLVSVAIKSRQPIERVVWVWAAILESAAEIDDNGRYRLDTAEVAYFLRADEADILSVVAALDASGRLDADAVVKWSNRQFRSDRSAERVASHRQRKRQSDDRSDGDAPLQNEPVTLQERHCNSPELELERDTENTLAETNHSTPNVRSIGKPMRPARDELQEKFWKAYPSRGEAANPKAPALEKFARAVKGGADPEEIIAAAARYAEVERRAGRAGTDKVAQAVTWLNQRRWGDYPAAAPSSESQTPPGQVFVARGSEAWDAWVATGIKPWSTYCKINQDEGRYFPSQFPPVQAYSGRGRDAA